MSIRFIALTLFAVTLAAQPLETVRVTTGTAARASRLPGELRPFLAVDLRARVAGFVESVEVDRGSAVRKGQLLVKLSAPELAAQVAEAESKGKAVEAQKAEAQAKLLAAQSTYDRLKAASATPGVVSGNELDLASKSVDANRAALAALDSAATAAASAILPIKQLQRYLNVEAPFDGIITERLVHPGALVGPASGALLHLEQNAKLRLVVSVPEAEAGVVSRGAALKFRVPAFPGQTFSATVSRIPHSLDAQTRTMPVEADVNNANGALAPGMYADVDWSARRAKASLLVPPAAIATTTERSFVIRVTGGKAEWVNVSKGVASGDLVEVFGALNDGDVIVKRASDEIRNGSAVAVK
ncbi:MAG: efflux RND transporter periplasmic adaptor subunit [Acidobacteriota bacterium]